MIFNVISYYDKARECFTEPMIRKESLDDLTTITKRSLVGLDQKQLSMYRSTSLVLVATFDDVKGEFVNKYQVLIDFEDMFPPVKEAAENV